MLLGAAGIVALAVLGLARLTIPDDPTFIDGLSDAAAGDDGSPDFMPTAIGGQLEVSGAREATITLDQVANGPSFGLRNSKTRIFFQGGPLTVSQFEYDGLSFFPDPEECQFADGEHNEDTGLAAAQVSCPELTDIRGNGTLTVEGVVVLPADLVLALEIPETGGVLTVGNEQWEAVQPMLMLGGLGSISVGDSGNGLWLGDFEHTKGVFLEHDEDSGTLSLSSMIHDGEIHEIASASCTIDGQELMVLNPEARLIELTIFCEAVEVPGLGTVLIEGTVIYDEIYVLEG